VVQQLVLIAPVVDPRRRTAPQQTADLLRDLLRETPASAALVISDFLRTGPLRFANALRSMLDYSTGTALQDIGCPVLVIRGANDPIARREWCLELAGHPIDGRLREIPRAGHVVQHTASERVAAEILTFSNATPAYSPADSPVEPR
jgi:pimeloyl-ACP methyl ester carboxylesterase